MSVSLRDKLRAFRVPFVVTTAIALAACTSNKDDGDATGGAGGSAGSTGGTGGSGGAGGTGAVVCPAEVPIGAELCATGASGTACEYALECQSGSQTFKYRCDSPAGAGGGTGSGCCLERTACANPYDSCSIPGDPPAFGQLVCNYGGIWFDNNSAQEAPPPCPEEKPEPGSSCTASDQGPPRCGYRCPGSESWTVGSCYSQTDPPQQVWAFDGACHGDCSNAGLLEYLSDHRRCTAAADCQVVQTSGCSSITDHCSGAVYVGSSGSEAEIQALDQALVGCQQPGGCATCDEPAPAAACVNGWCKPAGG